LSYWCVAYIEMAIYVVGMLALCVSAAIVVSLLVFGIPAAVILLVLKIFGLV
jgi:hypothetical protein